MKSPKEMNKSYESNLYWDAACCWIESIDNWFWAYPKWESIFELKLVWFAFVLLVVTSIFDTSFNVLSKLINSASLSFLLLFPNKFSNWLEKNVKIHIWKNFFILNLPEWILFFLLVTFGDRDGWDAEFKQLRSVKSIII